MDKTHLVDEITSHRRMRRNRRADWTRRMVQENRLTVDDLIWPIFLVPGTGIVDPIAAMPGVNRMSIDKAVEAVREAADLGIPAIATFPDIEMELRDETGSQSLSADNLINRATAAIKKAVPNIGIITDVALDPFTSHGHDGILRDGIIVNDETVDQIVRAAVMQADAGADIIAPSDMMDGRIGAIRRGLDAAGHQDVGIMSYATKFSSGFYGPYREAINTGGLLKGDKNSYYISPANGTEALRDAALDVEEGADMLMVKPGLPYLDICWRLKEAFGMPTFAYQVSGEYTQIKAAAMNGWIDGERIMMETLLCFKRAGCDGILSYFSLEVARKLAKGCRIAFACSGGHDLPYPSSCNRRQKPMSLDPNPTYIVPDDWRAYSGVLTRRAFAFVIDYTIVLLLCIPAAVVVFFLGIITLGLGFFLYPALFVIVALLYFGVTLGGPSQATLGMRALGIAMMRLDGRRIDFLTAMVHTVLFWIINSVLTPLILLAGLFTDRSRLVHDMLLGTVVVRTD